MPGPEGYLRFPAPAPFRGGAWRALGFLAGAFFAAGFLAAEALRALAGLAGAFRGAAFFAAGFLAAAFGAFLAAALDAFFAVTFGAAAFGAAHPDFIPLDAAEALARAQVEGAAGLCDGGHLRLWPHRHHSDGFFAAVWERRA